MSVPTQVVEDVVIKFAGDSGDGMQLTGSQFTNNTALIGNDLSTFPDFPAEIRAPQGTLPGVSGFQLRFSSNSVFYTRRCLRCIGSYECCGIEGEFKSVKT